LTWVKIEGNRASFPFAGVTDALDSVKSDSRAVSASVEEIESRLKEMVETLGVLT
jgi:hypothetical protein